MRSAGRDAELRRLISRPPDSPRARAQLFKTIPNYQTRQYASADLPGTNGMGDSRSVAKVAAIFATGGELDGIRFLSPRTVAQVVRERAYATDSFFEIIFWGLGVTL